LIYCYIADLTLGDPEWLPHPVRWIGGLVVFLESRFGGGANSRTERIKGAITALMTVSVTALAAYLAIKIAGSINPLLGSVVWVYLGYTTLSTRDLSVKARAVLKELRAGSLKGARGELSKIVGRDTVDLPEEKVVKATVESIAENTNDGIVAPLFYLILGGPVLAIAYKAVNTLDSMIGYKDERHINFGWFSAKADDIMNFIPARITGILICVSSIITARQGRFLAMTAAFKTMLRDGRKHPSPNSGITEAAMAGALGVRLGGPSAYMGRPLEKPHIGPDRNPCSPSLINEALAISFAASFLMLTLGVILKWAL